MTKREQMLDAMRDIIRAAQRGRSIQAAFETAVQTLDETFGLCSRCGNEISDYAPPIPNVMTTGYYVTSAWHKYARPNERLICESCMWADPLYIADYGPQPTPAGRADAK